MSIAFAMVWFATFGASPASGTQIRAEGKPYVEFDLSPLPSSGKGRYTTLTADKDIKLSESGEFDREITPEDVCQYLASFLNRNKFKAEVVDKTKLRV